MSPGARWALVIGGLLLFTLLPLPLVGPPLEAWLGAQAGAELPAGVAAALVVGLLALDVLAPVPSSIVATLAGQRLGLLGGAAAVWLGLSLGCGLGLVLGRHLGAARLRAFVGPEELDRARAWLERDGGALGLASARAVPMLAEASVLLAGATRASLRRVLPTLALANLGLALAYAGVGAAATGLASGPLSLLGALGLPALAMALARAR